MGRDLDTLVERIRQRQASVARFIRRVPSSASGGALADPFGLERCRRGLLHQREAVEVLLDLVRLDYGRGIHRLRRSEAEAFGD
jgi:DNA-directed RNA polymerase subunit N (RpoN/RPB10)